MAESARSRSRRRTRDAEQEEARESEQSGDDANGQDAPGNGTDSSGDAAAALSAMELTQAARDALAELTELEPESVTGLEWDGESWLVTIDVLELSRIPETTDVLATYVVQLDPSGSLLGYRRTRRFVRGQVEAE
jgi:Gas vesicle synthesis protein GvpO